MTLKGHKQRPGTGRGKAKPIQPPALTADGDGTGLQKWERFALEYVQLWFAGKPNATEAAKRAGYAVKSAYSTARDLLKKEHVAARITALTKAGMQEINVDGPMILREIASIGFAPITPGYIAASDKNKALQMLGDHHKLWEGSRGDRVININILAIDEKLL